MNDYHFVADSLNNHAYLAWRVGNDFFSDSYCGPYLIGGRGDRKVIKSKRIVLPSSRDLNGWILYADRLPETEDVYTPSDDVLTYDIRLNSLETSLWYPINMCWIDGESMCEYNEHRPTHWLPIPTIEEL